MNVKEGEYARPEYKFGWQPRLYQITAPDATQDSESEAASCQVSFTWPKKSISRGPARRASKQVGK